MEEEEGGGMRLSKRFSDKGGEVDYKTKSGTAWSHSYLNQKPWHPLSYPNQRRKWIAEQTNANHQRRVDEVAREFSQEQEFFRQTALVSKKEKEKVEMMKAVSFMYVRPPGYDPESAKAAEIADERKEQEPNDPSQDQPNAGPSTSMPPQSRDRSVEEKKKSRPKDVFGRSLPTEEEFEVLKNAPRMETGIAGRAKPFGVEVRNVKCLRCGTYGHQSGDRECLLKDAIMPNEESRLKRDDPLTAILAHTDASEPLKWELKQKPGISPPRGGFNHDDPNQQIVAEDIFDEYGGFLSGGNIPDLLTDFKSSLPKKKKSTRKSKHKRHSSPVHEVKAPAENGSSFDDDDDIGERRSKRKEKTHKKKKRNHSESYDDSEIDPPHRQSKPMHSYSRSSKYADNDGRYRSKHSESNDDSEIDSPHRKSKTRHSYSSSAKYKDNDGRYISKNSESYDDSEIDPPHRKSKPRHYCSSSAKYTDNDGRYRSKHSESHDDSEIDPSHRKSKPRHSYSSSSKYTDKEGRYRGKHHHRDQHRHRHHHRSHHSNSSLD